MNTKTRDFNLIKLASLTLLLLAGASTVKAEDVAENRLNMTSQGSAKERNGELVEQEFAALKTTGSRSTTTRSSAQQKLTSNAPAAPNVDFWVYDASVELFSDFDRDGYYSGIDLSFDVDTIYTAADVYAVIYLSLDFGPWNEYAVTEDFTIFGTSGNDEYYVESELVSGYVTGDYDILIELYDAFDGAFVASYGPDDNSSLSFLPLEDAARDAPDTTTQIVVNSGGGGSFGLLTLLALVAGVTVRRWS
ncbi:MAG: choice-of-anchor H family protein [Gammaproteobacteria bacterium]|nr:choice-of-anchor H family protein [Gammaproteobacteria bacterium]